MQWTRRTLIATTSAAILALSGTLTGCGTAVPERDRQITVFAAASLKNALDDATLAWEKDNRQSVTISYAGSSTLAKQLAQGAPADIFISANLEWMDYLAQRKLVDPATRADLLGNRLVLIAPENSDLSVRIATGFDLAGALGDGRLAMANTDAVPAGIYGETALGSLGVWDAVKDRIVQTQDVRAALALVSRGEAPLGIVYQTDAAADPDVKIIGIFPQDTHEPIVYPVALITTSKNGRTKHTAAQAFLDFLTSAKAAPYFERQGFTVLKQGN